jgi:hypothetical protein
MGADGFIVDPTRGYAFQLRCHQCGRRLDEGEPPLASHARCLSVDDRLPVSVEIDNYEER